MDGVDGAVEGGRGGARARGDAGARASTEATDLARAPGSGRALLRCFPRLVPPKMLCLDCTTLLIFWIIVNEFDVLESL